MTSEDDFQRMLDADPDDQSTRLVFADWLQDRDDPRAAGYRAIGLLNRRCWRSKVLMCWTHWNKAKSADGWLRLGSQACLPGDWYDSLFSLALDGAGYWSREQADDAAAVAFAMLPDERQREIMESALVAS